MIIKKQFTLNVFQCAQFREFERRLIKFIFEHYIGVVFLSSLIQIISSFEIKMHIMSLFKKSSERTTKKCL